MIRMHRRISSAVTMLTLAALVLTGCTSEASNIGRAQDKNGEPDVVDTGFTLSTVGSYDSADTAVVLSTDSDNKAVSFINMDTGKPYTLYYDGTTYVKDKHDGPMTISQIKAGDVVDITFLKGRKKLASIQRSPEAWVYDEVRNYDLAGSNRSASIGSQIYSLPESAVVLSDGRRVEAGEIVSQDVVTISGISHKIYSINVDRGHGYLRLKNDQLLLGGWIEVGNSVIRQISEDMLLTVPEGSYQVVLTNNNVGCVKEITVERGKEVVLDVGDLEVAEDAVGKILFTVEPEGATVSVDGKPVDISKPVELKYGIHQIQAEANGYDTLTKHIQVGSEYATISFKLEESRKNDGKDSVSDNSTTSDRIPWKDTMDSVSANNLNRDSISDNTLSVSENALGTSNKYKVYVDSPKGVEVYLDGNYMGISPVRFTKTVGRHEITLKKSGYKTKTYTIYLENTRKDETYSFSALEKEGSDGTKKTIPEEITSAVSELSDCKLTEGTDWIAPEDYSRADLLEAGKEKIIASVKNAVKEKIGETEAEKYTFTVEKDDLENVTLSGSEDGKGTAAVTIYRAGYETQTAGCNVLLAKKGEEPSGPDEERLSLTVTTDSNEAGPGDTVTFTAEVKNSSAENPIVSWEYTDFGFDGSVIESDNSLILSVESVESEETFSATATYEETGQSVSETVSIDVVPVVGHTCNPQLVEKTEPNCTTAGRQAYYHCGDCGKNYEDDAGENVIVDINAWGKIDALGHDWGEWEETTESGKQERSCTRCNTKETKSITGNGGGQGNPNGTTGEGGGEPSAGTDGGQSGGTVTETDDETVTENNNNVANADTELTAETFTVTQEAHPIKKWFSSLFKK